MMNHVNRAILMAAGRGKRLRPLTDSIPKPLIRVSGIPMIETIINALRKNGINEIYVVTGYLKEQFLYLTKKYEDLVLIENPYFDKCNNISSLYMARDYIGDSIILDADQIIYNTDILSPDFDISGYSGIYTKEYTNEWLLSEVDGIISSCSRTGGENGYRLCSISRWTKEDAKRLKGHIEIQFEHYKNHDIYWDDIPIFIYPEEYRLRIYPIDRGDVSEIDSISELLDIDASYKDLLRGR